MVRVGVHMQSERRKFDEARMEWLWLAAAVEYSNEKGCATGVAVGLEQIDMIVLTWSMLCKSSSGGRMSGGGMNESMGLRTVEVLAVCGGWLGIRGCGLWIGKWGVRDCLRTYQ